MNTKIVFTINMFWMIVAYCSLNNVNILQTKTSVRIFCMVPSMYSKSKLEQWDAILKTWGKKCSKIRFFIDPTSEIIPHQFFNYVVQVDMKRSHHDRVCADGKPCRHIWEKVWRSWVYVEEHFLGDAEWFAKIDDDSYFIFENFERLLHEKQWSYKDTHYFGHKLYYGSHEYVSGAGTFFSRETIKRLAPVYRNMEHEYGDRSNFKHGRCVDRDGATEERTTTICLHNLGIHPAATTDNDGKERILLWQIPAHLKKERNPNSTGWYWWKKPKYIRGKTDCCSDFPIIFHPYKSANEFWKLHHKLYSGGKSRDPLEEEYLKKIRSHLNLPNSNAP